MKKKWLIILFISGLFLLIGCGITEELDRSKETVDSLKTALTEQKESFQTVESLLQKTNQLLDKKINTSKTADLFEEQEGNLYQNYSQRQLLLKKMEKAQKTITQAKKDLDKIISKNGVDVPNDQLSLISQSIEIINSNFESYQVYLNTSFDQEKRLYSSLPITNFEEQASIVGRTFGSISLSTEEATANINYSLGLIRSFNKTIQSEKK